LTNEQFVKAQLCLYAWREAHEKGLNEMEAILFVLRNRYRAGWGEWLSLAKCDGGEYPSLQNYDFQMLLQRVDYIFDGSAPDKMTEGALYYADLTDASEDFVEKIVRNPEEHPRCASISSLYFFR
jgi:hypothetical protein